MSHQLEGFWAKFRFAELQLERTQFWTIAVRLQQITPGALVCALNRPCPSLAALTSIEWADFGAAVSKIELLLSRLAPTRINYLALMLVDRHVHFHVIPRYDKPVGIQGMTVEDVYWPNPPRLDEPPASMISAEKVLKFLSLPQAEEG